MIVKNHYSHKWTSCRDGKQVCFMRRIMNITFFDEQDEKLAGVKSYHGYLIG